MDPGPFLDLVQFLGLTSAVTYALVDAPAAGVLGFLVWGALVGRLDPRPSSLPPPPKKNRGQEGKRKPATRGK